MSKYTFITTKAYNNIFYEAINEQFKFQCDPSGKVVIYENQNGIYEFKKSLNIRVSTTTIIKERFESLVKYFDEGVAYEDPKPIYFYTLSFEEVDNLIAINDIKLNTVFLTDFEIEKINENHNIYLLIDKDYIFMPRYNEIIPDLSDSNGGKPINIFKNEDKLYIFPSKTCDINEALKHVVSEFNYNIRVKFNKLDKSAKKLQEMLGKNELLYETNVKKD